MTDVISMKGTRILSVWYVRSNRTKHTPGCGFVLTIDSMPIEKLTNQINTITDVTARRVT